MAVCPSVRATYLGSGGHDILFMLISSAVLTYTRRTIAMNITLMELLAILTLIVIIISLVVDIYNNKK